MVGFFVCVTIVYRNLLDICMECAMLEAGQSINIGSLKMKSVASSFFTDLFLISFVAVAVGAIFTIWDSTPQMAWSHSLNKCQAVTRMGKLIPNGCQKVAKGEITAERYFVR